MSNATNDHLGPTDATSRTEFGQSVESQAQMKDATLMATAEPEVLNIYRLVPIAEPSDPSRAYRAGKEHGAVLRACGSADIVWRGVARARLGPY